MTTAPWFPFYIGDYQADTMHLTRDQHGAYFLLMMAYYRRARALPDDNHYLAGIVKASGGEWRYLRPVMAEFFQIEDGLWRHKRIDAELAGQKAHREARSERGRANANKRWQNGTKSTLESMPHVMPPHDELGLQNFGGLIDQETNKINGPEMLLSQSQFDTPNGVSHRARRAREARKISPAQAWYEGAYLAAQSYTERHGLDRSDDRPPDGPLLDGGGDADSAPVANGGLARRPG